MRKIEELLKEETRNKLSEVLNKYFQFEVEYRFKKSANFYKEKGYDKEEIKHSTYLHRNDTNRVKLYTLTETPHSQKVEFVGETFLYETDMDYPKYLNVVIDEVGKEIDELVKDEILNIKRSIEERNFDIDSVKNVTIYGGNVCFKTEKGIIEAEQAYTEYVQRRRKEIREAKEVNK